jgi:tryptophan-rich sensory protein
MPLRPLIRIPRGLPAWLGLVFAVAAAGGLAPGDAPVFYQQLVLPPWAPPGWLFGPAWGVLYPMLGVAAWLVWRARGWGGAPLALGLFVAQLLANLAWTFLFFSFRLGGIAFAEALLLWLLLLATTIAFWRVRPLAGALLLPTLAWVAFACALNHAAWRLNPALLGG